VQGGYRACNYFGMVNNPSPFLKMSFERSVQFVHEATVGGEFDPIRSPASRFVCGKTALVGTGCVDILQY